MKPQNGDFDPIWGYLCICLNTGVLGLGCEGGFVY